MNYENTSLHIAPMNARDCWIVTQDYITEDKIVPRGTITDLDSVPKIPFIHAFMKGRSRFASPKHDLGYFCDNGDTRAEVDETYRLDCIKYDKQSRFMARLLWLGVRIGGWRYWKTMQSHKLKISCGVDQIEAENYHYGDLNHRTGKHRYLISEPLRRFTDMRLRQYAKELEGIDW